MVKGIDKRLKQQMSAFRTKNVKVYIGVSPVAPDLGSDWERIRCEDVYEDPEEVAGKLMDLSLTHYVWDWNVSEIRGGMERSGLRLNWCALPAQTTRRISTPT